ncbi:putative peroxidase-related enzyme [Allocatelliglobosispora scoriae]|uniref:Putative peroxidase-related enzyme n=1 Tax=Allocatelliglobosispora scoriae TaxID=643052 RepID=A0A841BLW0_9ACTN|nr:peroxidase-related enzyme [Allocatelliglobosispora scoriae]MBB5868348.1 putative peroxidase-related enzyme [Allocatelliglobosispora scoriae]
MSFLRVPDEADATPEAASLLAADRAANGFVANYTEVFSLRPAVLAAWQQLNVTIKGGMDLRRYELVTLAAARALKSSYCALAHGKVLRDRFYDAETVRAIATHHGSAGLDASDVAVMTFAEKVVADATAITEADVEELRGHGLGEEDILQVVLAATARCFFSKTLDAVGAEPDAHYVASVEPDLRQALTVGRPVAAAE